jgi:nitroreductase
MNGQSGRGLPHSKTLARYRVLPFTRQVLDMRQSSTVLIRSARLAESGGSSISRRPTGAQTLLASSSKIPYAFPLHSGAACSFLLFVQENSKEKLAPILSRRSIRAYSQKAVSDEVIRQLLEAAMAAPSAVARDPWRFVIVRQQPLLEAIADALPNGQMLRSAAAGIFVCGDLNAAHDRQLSYLLQDCAAATENLLLAAHLLGLGACWLGIHPREQRVKHLKELFGLPESVLPVAGISLGYPAEVKEPRTRFTLEAVHLEHWGQKPTGQVWD